MRHLVHTTSCAARIWSALLSGDGIQEELSVREGKALDRQF